MFKKIKIYYLRLRSKILTPRINRDIKKYKYVHVMKNDKFNKSFVDFLNKNFDSTEHMILCYRACKNKPPTLFPKGGNVYEYVYFKDIKGLLDDNIDKIIFHSLFMPGVVDRLYREPELLKKSYWVIWGGDLYNAPRDEKNDFVRKNFKGYISLIAGDEKVAKEKYNSKSLLFTALGPVLMDKSFLEKIPHVKTDKIVIQINNSCDDSTLDMLDILSKYKNKDIIIRTILSYGKMQYKDKIKEKGKKIFGDKFQYLDKLILSDDYGKFLSENDILILCQNRQQGLGNAIYDLALGAKVFLPYNTTSLAFVESYNLKVFDSLKIKDMSIEEFIEYPENLKKRNMHAALTYCDNSLRYEKCRKMWQKIFLS